MDEYVLPTILRLDEAVALRRVEPLYVPVAILGISRALITNAAEAARFGAITQELFM